MNTQKKYSLVIVHLYPELLNLYGDKGNIIAIQKRCEWRDIDVTIHEINEGDDINPDLYDIYFIGGGQDQQQIDVSKELQKQKVNLHKAADSMAVFLSICGGYQLLGHYYKPHNGDKLMGISILDAYTIAGHKRHIGNVTIEADYVTPKTLVGFENHSGLTYLKGDTKPMGKTIIGSGNNAEDSGEGGRYKNVFGTYLHGSLLPKNPHFTDYLIELSLKRKYGEDATLKPLDDTLEKRAHKEAISRKY